MKRTAIFFTALLSLPIFISCADEKHVAFSLPQSIEMDSRFICFVKSTNSRISLVPWRIGKIFKSRHSPFASSVSISQGFSRNRTAIIGDFDKLGILVKNNGGIWRIAWTQIDKDDLDSVTHINDEDIVSWSDSDVFPVWLKKSIQEWDEEYSGIFR